MFNPITNGHQEMELIRVQSVAFNKARAMLLTEFQEVFNSVDYDVRYNVAMNAFHFEVKADYDQYRVLYLPFQYKGIVISVTT